MSRSRTSLLLAGLLFAGACGSSPDAVCEDIGNCSHGGSHDWISACQAEAKSLEGTAADAGCGPDFTAYFGCAESAYTCTGATVSFPGCDDRRSALDACLVRATAGTSCAALAAAESACAASMPDGGATAATATGLPPACTAARDCQARCYLDRATNACAPRIDELEAATACAGACPL